jgi:hypothetical protein
MLARRFLPLPWPAFRPHAGASQFWSNPQPLTHAQPLATGYDLPPSRPRRTLPGSRTSRGRVWGLMVVGFFPGVPALSLPETARLVVVETMSLLHVMALRSAASPVLSRSEEHLLPTAAHLASSPDESFALDDCDWDDDNSSDMPLLIRKALVLPLTAGYVGFNGLTHASLWPTHYLVRPQLLLRL